MLFNKFQDHLPFGSGERFAIYGRGGHLDHLTSRIIRIKFHFPNPWRLQLKFGFDWPSGFGDEDI